MDILANTNLFNTHIAEIDIASNNYPFSSKSTTPQKETTPSIDHYVTLSFNQTHHVLPTPQASDSNLVDTPIMHVQDNTHLPLHGPKKKLWTHLKEHGKELCPQNKQ